MHATHTAWRRIGVATLALGLAGVAGCGAKTGLIAPDVVDASDASFEAAVDAQADVLCIEPDDAAHATLTVDLHTNAQIAVADVLFVIDRTGSMTDEIANIRNGLRTTIVPGLVHQIPDLHLGLVTFADFPTPTGNYGEGPPTPDVPFSLDRALDDQFTALQGAIANIVVGNGGDNPEAHVETLYQIATGEGLTHWIPPSGGCPTIGVGYACFRPRAEAVMVMISDAPFHNGPGNTNAYNPADFAPWPAPHTYLEMVAAVNARLHARVIGINSGVAPFWGRDDLVQVARDTGAVSDTGAPLVFDINPDGTGLSEQVVQAVQLFTASVRLNVSARAVDIDGSGIASLVTAVVPVSATPMTNVTRVDGTTFYGVVPGTQLTFGLEIDLTRVMQTDQEQHFTVRIEFLSDGRPTLGYQDVPIVIPARMGMRCPR